MVFHPIGPVYFPDARILILGSFPSVKSRESGFYYGHPQNRFWSVLAEVLEEEVPDSKANKIELLKRNRIALWDVLERCEITGSSDTSIRDEAPNDLNRIFDCCSIRRIYTNGKTAHALYQKYLLPVWEKDDVCLPSTSPANAVWNLDKLVQTWRTIKEEL